MTVKKALFIYNPISGSRFVPKELDTIVEHFQREDIQVELFRLEEGNNDQLRKMLHSDKRDMIVAAGGDGTIGNIADILVKEEIDLPYGTLGTGTCNNFTHNIDMPGELEKAIRIIGKGETILVDVGRVNREKVFLSSFAGGVFAGISYETSPDKKQFLGPFAYYMQALSEIKNIKAHKMKITTAEQVLEESVYLVLVLNGTNVGSFKNVFPKEAIDISDGVMEMILVKESGPLEIANSLMAFMKDEQYEGLSNVQVLRSHYFSLEGGEAMSVSLDGEKGSKLPAEIEVLHKRLKVFKP